MLRLLKIEWNKIRYHRASILLIIAYFFILTSLSLLALVKFKVGSFEFDLAEQGIFNFPYIWHLNTYLAGTLKIFLMLIIVSMVSNEYSFNTLKQNLIDGLSKKEFYLSKFLMVVVFSLVSTIFVVIITLILGLKYSSFTELSVIMMDFEYVLAYFIKLVAYFSLGLFLGVLIKRSALAIGMLIVWYALESIIIGLLKWWFRLENDELISQFLPLTAMSNLIKEPITRFQAVKSAVSELGQTVQKDFSVHTTDIIINIFWIVVFAYATYFILKKRDL